MRREVRMEDISDGRLYGSNDMVKAGCGGCVGCFACCCHMGTSIVLDPLDAHRLSKGMSKGFEELIGHEVELNVADGLILPNLKMAGQEERCAFLNEQGRCSIHEFRPGICRLFPLGRYYEDRSFRYFLQTHECKQENRTKVKVKKWLDTPDLEAYETFICDWHFFLADLQNRMDGGNREALARAYSLELLQTFYLTPYEEDVDFYSQFAARLQNVKKRLEK
ncbi:MAG: YkgJ family cysteine cluster protein [Lachnospiraceae bacterium]